MRALLALPFLVLGNWLGQIGSKILGRPYVKIKSIDLEIK